jgi:hypothetical protein
MLPLSATNTNGSIMYTLDIRTNEIRKYRYVGNRWCIDDITAMYSFQVKVLYKNCNARNIEEFY